MDFLLSLGGIHGCQVKQDVPLSLAGMKDRDKRDCELEGTRSREREAEIEEGGIEEKGEKNRTNGDEKRRQAREDLKRDKKKRKNPKEENEMGKEGNFKRRRKKDKNR